MASKKTRALHDEVMALGLNIPNGITREQTAVVILPGGGEGTPPTRLTEVPWQNYTDDLWVAGTRGDPAYSRGEIEGYVACNGKLPLRLATQLYAEHTPSQMKWAVEHLLDQPRVQHVIISTASYHLVRGALTFIKCWNNVRDDRMLTLGLIATSDPPEELLATTTSTTSRTLEQELDRIEVYQAKGDVATADEFHQFLKEGT